MHWLLVTLLSVFQTQPAAPCERVDGGSQLLSAIQRTTLKVRHPGFEVKRQCGADLRDIINVDARYASVAAGDFDADGRIDVAVLVESRTQGRTLVVVFMSSVRGGPVVAGDGDAYVTTISRGTLGHDFDTETDFTYTTDAIFTGDLHCCGASLIWRDGKFARNTTGPRRPP